MSIVMKYVFKKKYLIVFISILDAVGSILTYPFRMFRGQGQPKKDSKILLMRLDHIGDVIMSTGAIRLLREAYPEASIDVMVSPLAVDIIKDNPAVDNVISFDAPWFRRNPSAPFFHIRAFFKMIRDIRKKKYDIAIDLRGDMRHIAAIFAAGVPNRIGYGITGGGFFLTDNVPYDEKKHEIEKNAVLLQSLNIYGSVGDPEIFSSEEEAKSAEKLKEDENIKEKYAVLHTVPGHFTRVWGIDEFSFIVRYIKEKGMKPVLIGTEKDRDFAGSIIENADSGALNIAGKTDLKDLFHIIKGASLFVGLDSGPGHIASCVETPAVIIFSGINDVEQWAPRGKCIEVVCPDKGKDLSAMTTEEVCQAIDEVLGVKK